jgi:hypothetical protein
VTVGQISWVVFWGALALGTALIALWAHATKTREGGARQMLNAKVISWSLAIWGGISFVLCVLYGLILPGTLAIHQSLEQLLPGFRWLTWWGFLIGLAWSLVYGLYAGWLFSVVYNWVNKQWGAAR